MKCANCGKVLGEEYMSVSANGIGQENKFCGPECWGKATRKAARLIKKHGLKEILRLIEEAKKTGRRAENDCKEMPDMQKTYLVLAGPGRCHYRVKNWKDGKSVPAFGLFLGELSQLGSCRNAENEEEIDRHD